MVGDKVFAAKRGQAYEGCYTMSIHATERGAWDAIAASVQAWWSWQRDSCVSIIDLVGEVQERPGDGAYWYIHEQKIHP